MGRRIACIALPDIRLEIARESEPQPVLAVIVARAGGAVQTDRDVLGNTRIDVVSHEAGAFGVRPGQTVAAARAKCAALRVRVVPNATVQTTLARVAEAMLAFGPTTAFDAALDVVWVDVGGCAHLHGGDIELAQALGATVRSMGHACRVAVADGPRVASAVARFSTRPKVHVASSIPEEPVVVPEGQGAFAVRSLPIAALALDDDVSAWLEDLGLSTCGDLQKLPRKALGMRLGERAHDVMQLLDGRDLAPLEAWRPPEVPEERVELEWGAHATESLAFVLKILCDRLAARLYGRALAAARLELVLALDRALLPSPSVRAGPLPAETEPCPHRLVLPIILPSPIARAADLLSIVRVRLEGCSLPAPVLAVTLRAPDLARAPGRTLDLLSPEPKAHRALPRLVAELSAELGEGVVGTLELVDTWSPVERTRLMPLKKIFLSSDAWAELSTAKSFLVTSALEPSRLIHATPVAPAVLTGEQRVARIPHIAHIAHIARIEAVEWWRHPSPRRDLLAAWIDGALAWLELSAHPGACPLLRGWID